MNSKDFIQLDETWGAHNYHPLDVVVAEADGIYVTDVDGKQYIDFLSAYSAVNQGHCHPKIMAAMQKQMQRVTLTSRAFRNDQMGLFLKELCELTGYEMALPMNTGAEAVETAIKTARKWGYDVKGVARDSAEIIVCDGNFHGRTTTVISFSPDTENQEYFGPITPGFITIPYGDVAALEAAITPNTVGFLFEPIQGEGGVIVPPEGFLKNAYDICNRNNVLFIADEIQSGLGRAGALFACDHEGVKPDIAILGKALSGGFYPVSAIVASKEILGVFNPGDHGSTYGGNPLGAAVGRAAMEVLVEEQLPQKSLELGAYFIGRLQRIESDYIHEVRGRGLWVGLELNTPARPFCEALQKRGLLCKETHVNTIRFAPPLIITKEQLDYALDHIEAVLMNGNAA